MIARGGARASVAMSAAPGLLPTGMTAHERFLFDLNGFLVVRNVFTPEEVRAANAAIDANAASMRARDAQALRNAKTDTPFSAAGPRKDMGGMLWWPREQSAFFRSVLTHPKLVPYYTALLGEGYRMDHQPLVIAQDAQSEGFSLHGGPIKSDGRFNPELQYRCVHGDIWTSLLACSVQLCDHNENEGGFVVVRGSHKLNLPVPADVANGLGGDDVNAHLYQPTTKECLPPEPPPLSTLILTSTEPRTILTLTRRATSCYFPRQPSMARSHGE